MRTGKYSFTKKALCHLYQLSCWFVLNQPSSSQTFHYSFLAYSIPSSLSFTCEYSIVIYNHPRMQHGHALGRDCLRVCLCVRPVRALTFESFDLRSWYAVFMISRSWLSIKVTGSRSRSRSYERS